MRFKRFLLGSTLLAAASLLGGCGGSSGQIGVGGTSGGTTGGVPPGPTASSLTLLASAPQLSSDSSDTATGITLSALVRDSNQNVVPDVQVIFGTLDSAQIVVSQPTTDASGLALATVTTGGDPRNRSITLTATSGAITGTVTVDVVGTALALSAPTNAQSGTPISVTATLTDASGDGISGQSVAITSSAGNALSASSLTTNSSGQATFTVTGTNSNQLVDTITAAALGTSTTVDITFSPDDFQFSAPAANTQIALGASQPLEVTWRQNGNPVAGQIIDFSTTRGVITPSSATTNSSGQVTVAISSTSAGSATVQATSAALTRPANTLPLAFIATNPASIDLQPSPAVISTGAQSDVSATVRDANNNLVTNAIVDFTLNDVTNGTLSAPTATTNTQGVARVVYTASNTPSARDGVEITATVRNRVISSTGFLTVGSRAVRITLGTGNQIFEPNETTYQLPYTAIVTDSAGNPVPDADFTISVTPTEFATGFYNLFEGRDAEQVITSICVNEDTNNNGILDVNEDLNGNGVLDPGNAASVPGAPVLGPDGSVQFNITYPQDRGNWVVVLLTARVSVSGTESVENREFLLPIVASDAENPPGNPSPYGRDPNPACAVVN